MDIFNSVKNFVVGTIIGADDHADTEEAASSSTQRDATPYSTHAEAPHCGPRCKAEKKMLRDRAHYYQEQAEQNEVLYNEETYKNQQLQDFLAQGKMETNSSDPIEDVRSRFESLERRNVSLEGRNKSLTNELVYKNTQVRMSDIRATHDDRLIEESSKEIEKLKKEMSKPQREKIVYMNTDSISSQSEFQRYMKIALEKLTAKRLENKRSPECDDTLPVKRPRRE